MSPPLRILRVSDVADNRTGGMTRTIHATGDELIRSGHSVEYLFGDGLALRSPLRLRRFFAPLRIVRRVRERLAAGHRYDVVEIHEPFAAAYAWHRRSLPPLVLFSYGLEDRGRHAMLAYRRQKGIPISLKTRYSPLTVVKQATYAAVRAAHVICSNSEDVEHLVGRGVPRARLTRHHSGVEPEFLRAGSQLDPAAPRRGILFLGGWFERKGILDLVPAVTEVLREFPAEHFTVAGCHLPEAEVRERFPAEVRPQVRVVPFVRGNEALIPFYRDHSVFVLPSYFEGQPLVMIEAAALGMAIVTTHICGMKDFIVPGENGLTVPVANPAALASALRDLLREPRRARQLGEAAHLLAQTHTWTSAAEKIERAYRAAAQLPP